MTIEFQKRREELLEFLKALPEEQFDYSFLRKETECGTVACVAGWCSFLWKENKEVKGSVSFTRRYLGLTSRESNFLAFVGCGYATHGDAIERLQWLVDHGSFEGYPLYKESWYRGYMKRYPSHVQDFFRVLSPLGIEV